MRGTTHDELSGYQMDKDNLLFLPANKFCGLSLPSSLSLQRLPKWWPSPLHRAIQEFLGADIDRDKDLIQNIIKPMPPHRLTRPNLGYDDTP